MPTRRSAFLAVLAILGGVFVLTADWSLPGHIDPGTNAVTGWYLGTTGNPIASDYSPMAAAEQPANLFWIVESPRGPVSQYPPGAAIPPALIYALSRPDASMVGLTGSNDPGQPAVLVPLPPLWPAALSAVLVTAAALAVLALVLMDQGVERRKAVVGSVLAGLATGAWSVASSMSWTHGPAMLTMSLALWAASRDRWWMSGLALGAGVLVRPHIAVIAAVIGIWVSLARREWSPLLGVGLGSSVGLVALLAYNYWVWGTVTLSGGYSGGFSENFLYGGFAWFVGNVVGGLLDPERGLLVWAPFLLVLVPAAWFSRDEHPDWSLAAAVGGAVYLLVQWRANRFSGGGGFFAYRYPLVALMAMAPSLFFGFERWVQARPLAGRALRFTLAVAIAGQAAGAVLT